jgi:hypothetical protein
MDDNTMTDNTVQLPSPPITTLNLHVLLDALIEKYQNNEYVYGRLVNYIENLLPTALENDTALQKQREERRIQLSANRDEFTTRFLKKNSYYYSAQTELFLHYDGLHFVIHSEDDIQHQILTTISSEKCLRDWKHKVNKNIIKRIKDKSPLKAIPESATIQFVINQLCPFIFPTRNHAKYFLTIIGECLSSKNDATENKELEQGAPTSTTTTTTTTTNSLIYIIPPALKDIIREIGNQCYTYFGLPNVFTNIKYKYYDHNYKDCRLLYVDRCYGRKKVEVPSLLTKHMLDFLCVAAHYGTRYGSSDAFLNHCTETKLVEHAYFLSKNTAETIVSKFIDKSLTLCASSSVDTKNMIFLWKHFLNDIALPNIIFYESLKTILKHKLKYDEEKDYFTGITSIHLPAVSQFIKFWDETMVMCNDSNDNEYNELEIDEVCILFKQWSPSSYSKVINDVLILDLIQHFYSDIILENNKFIVNVKSTLWDKRKEVIDSFTLFKKETNAIINLDTNDAITTKNSISYDTDPYQHYCAQKKNKYNLLVSKEFYEKIVLELDLDLNYDVAVAVEVAVAMAVN